MRKTDLMLRELKEHLPFTLVVSLFAGVLVALIYVFGTVPSEILFEVAHPLHILVSAAATAGLFSKYKGSFVKGVFVGFFGALLVGTISDVLLPWVAGNLFGFESVLHLPFLESPILIFGSAILGSFVGLRFGMFKLNHSLHVFLSVFASLFYLLAFSSSITVWAILGFSLIVFFVVYIPCCISDIIFPIFFLKK